MIKITKPGKLNECLEFELAGQCPRCGCIAEFIGEDLARGAFKNHIECPTEGCEGHIFGDPRRYFYAQIIPPAGTLRPRQKTEPEPEKTESKFGNLFIWAYWSVFMIAVGFLFGWYRGGMDELKLIFGK